MRVAATGRLVGVLEKVKATDKGNEKNDTFGLWMTPVRLDGAFLT